MKWQQGCATIDGMIARRELERVPASRAHADLLLAQAQQHVKSAQAIVASRSNREPRSEGARFADALPVAPTGFEPAPPP